MKSAGEPMTTISLESVKSVLIEPLFDGQELSKATAFFVNYKGYFYLLTNKHNVTGRDVNTGVCLSKTGGAPNSLRVWMNSNTLGVWFPLTIELYANDQPLFKEHPRSDGSFDFVAMQILNRIGNCDYHAYNLPEPDIHALIAPSIQVNVIGFPFGLSTGGRFAIWSTGFVASEPDIDYDCKPVFLIDCRSRQGQSGSPVVFHSAIGQVKLSNGQRRFMSGPYTELLGIYSGRINSESDLGRVWKVTAIIELLDSFTT